MSEEFQRLSEGYDFIEEECGLSEGLTFEETNETIISESTRHKSPFKIIGAVKGVIQPIGELSRNRRSYPQNFWYTILDTPEIQERLASRDMLGCISHADKKVDCADLKSGEVSHIVTKLEIRENEEGAPFLYGEMEILDTPAGRIIKALYEGGANIYVSTRGAGKLRDLPGKPYKEVIPESFYLETIDFVRRPGFVKAHPAFEAVELTTTEISPAVSEAADTEKVFHADSKVANPMNEDVESLKAQVEKLAKIIEKVVDDVYETEEATEAPKKEVSEEQQAALLSALAVLTEANLSEEAMEEVLEEIKRGLK